MSEDTKKLSQLTQKNLEANQQTVAAAKANAAANFVNAKTNRDQTGVLKQSNKALTDQTGVLEQSNKALTDIHTSVAGLLKKSDEDKGKSDEDKELKVEKVDVGGGEVWDAIWDNMPPAPDDAASVTPESKEPEENTEEKRELSKTLSVIKERLGDMGKGIKNIATNTAGILKDALAKGFSIFGILAAALLVFDPELYMDLLTTGLGALANFAQELAENFDPEDFMGFMDGVIAGLRGLSNFAQDIFSIFNPDEGESRLGNIMTALKEHWGKVLSLLGYVLLKFGVLGKAIKLIFSAIGGIAKLAWSLTKFLSRFLLKNPIVLLIAGILVLFKGIIEFFKGWEQLEEILGTDVSFFDAFKFGWARLQDTVISLKNGILEWVNGVIRWYNDSFASSIFGEMEELDIDVPEQTNAERVIEELKAKNAKEQAEQAEQSKLIPEQTAVGANEVTPMPPQMDQLMTQFLAPQNNIIDNSSNSSSAISITQPVESKTSAFNRYNRSLIPL